MPELGEADASYYHTLIGVLRWIVEFGRIDINVEVSMMSSHLALPRGTPEGAIPHLCILEGSFKRQNGI